MHYASNFFEARHLREENFAPKCHIEGGRMSASCPKVSFALPSVSRECGRLCVPYYSEKFVPSHFKLATPA